LADRNKLRQDAALTLDWYTDEGLVSSTDLGRLVNARAELSLGRRLRVHERFLSQRWRGLPAHRQIVRLTRGTPRDLIVFLRELGTAVGHAGVISGRTFTRAARAYATDYLWYEIGDEIETYLPEGAAATALDGLRTTGPTFRAESFMDPVFGDVNAARLIRLLYDCGAIGERVDNAAYFRYANPSREPSLAGEFLVHPGLRPAL
jgi:hypothetical protein